MSAVAYLECPACSDDGIASTGIYCATCGEYQDHDDDCTGELGPGWTEADGGPCVSCGIALRVCIEDGRAYCTEVEA